MAQMRLIEVLNLEYSCNVSKERVRTFSKSLGSFSSDNVP